jgi:hypothetical protein
MAMMMVKVAMMRHLDMLNEHEARRLPRLRHMTHDKGELEFAARRRREAVLRRMARAPPPAG